jgi:acyl-coenzyme A thioesterase PaaI-like protein
MRKHGDMCLVCGPAHPAGLRLRLFAGEGVSTYGHLDVTETHQGPIALLHGGFLSAAFDELMGAVNWLHSPATVTGRLDVVFRQPVPVGSHLHLRAWSVGVDGRKNFVAGDCRLNDACGAVVAEAAAVFVRADVVRVDLPGGSS